MTTLSEIEIIDRHKQALGEAHRACQRLGRNADTDYLALRGGDYSDLKKAITMLEGSARQMGPLRADARWVKLGIFYARVLKIAEARYKVWDWNAFNEMKEVFALGQRRIDELQAKTGTISPILPKRASEWLWMPEPKTTPPRRLMH